MEHAPLVLTSASACCAAQEVIGARGPSARQTAQEGYIKHCGPNSLRLITAQVLTRADLSRPNSDPWQHFGNVHIVQLGKCVRKT
jgi:hypothetical protein